MVRELKQFGRELRRLINSPEVFSLLREGDWGAGGCWVLASALVEFLGSPAELYVVTSDGMVEHVLVRYVDMYIDNNGAQTKKELDRNISEDPHYQDRSWRLGKFTKKLQERAREEGYIDCDIGMVKALRSYLYKAFFT